MENLMENLMVINGDLPKKYFNMAIENGTL